jgi:hypothetical protein
MRNYNKIPWGLHLYKNRRNEKYDPDGVKHLHLTFLQTFESFGFHFHKMFIKG